MAGGDYKLLQETHVLEAKKECQINFSGGLALGNTCIEMPTTSLLNKDRKTNRAAQALISMAMKWTNDKIMCLSFLLFFTKGILVFYA